MGRYHHIKFLKKLFNNLINNQIYIWSVYNKAVFGDNIVNIVFPLKWNINDKYDLKEYNMS